MQANNASPSIPVLSLGMGSYCTRMRKRAPFRFLLRAFKASSRVKCLFVYNNCNEQPNALLYRVKRGTSVERKQKAFSAVAGYPLKPPSSQQAESCYRCQMAKRFHVPCSITEAFSKMEISSRPCRQMARRQILLCALIIFMLLFWIGWQDGNIHCSKYSKKKGKKDGRVKQQDTPLSKPPYVAFQNAL
uniref:Transmembrane protein n=1 Tax=Micrurus corallinus TaxID=54390 RepID=A0A2D4GD64_MICCO